MNSRLLLCLAFLASVPARAIEIKSADGRTIEAELVETNKKGIKIEIKGTTFDLSWDKLDKDQAHEFQRPLWVTVEYDKFKDHTTVRALVTNAQNLKPELGGSFEVRAYDVLEGKFTRPSRDIAMAFWHRSSDWSWLKHHDVVVLVDGVKMPVKASLNSTEVMDGGIFESMFMQIPDANFLKLCAAKSIEIQVGYEEFKVAEETIEGFKWLAEILHVADPETPKPLK